MTAMFHDALFDFSDQDIHQAAADHRLLAVEIEFNRLCNYRCPYCYVGETSATEMDSSLADQVITDAAALGAQKIVVLGGEPLLYSRLWEKLDLINRLGMGAEVFTNASLIDDDAAARLGRRDCRVVVKLNSLDPAVQERMTGVHGALDKTMQAIALLRKNGFDRPGRLAASTVICTDNLDGLTELWAWIRDGGMLPYFEIMTPQGRMLEHPELNVTTNRIRTLFLELQRLDAERYGRHWDAQPPLVGGKCLRHLYSCLVNPQGDVMPCVGLNAVIGNVATQPLADILARSALLNDLKNYRQKIKPPCRGCDQAENCYGCRGAAYQLTGDYLAADPMCWRNADRLADITCLPCSARPLIPHQPPMAMVDSIASTGEISHIRTTIRADNRFLDGDGRLDPEALLEIAAQACAAFNSLRDNGVISPGMLAGATNLVFEAEVQAGDELDIAVRETAVIDKIHLVDFTITRLPDLALAARGEIKLCLWEP
jgi:radical SAM protein with 4Fe4S-binding SPASM domain